MLEGEWVRGVTAGGCRNYLETFRHNPQYCITLEDPDDEVEDNKYMFNVVLIQKNRRSQRKVGMECLAIGNATYHLQDPNSLPKPLDLNIFKYNASVARSPLFVNLRDVSRRFKLPPGVYCIVSSTFETNDDGKFILRPSLSTGTTWKRMMRRLVFEKMMIEFTTYLLNSCIKRGMWRSSQNQKKTYKTK
jgi:calpain